MFTIIEFAVQVDTKMINQRLPFQGTTTKREGKYLKLARHKLALELIRFTAT